MIKLCTVFIPLLLLTILVSCMEKEKSVTLGSSFLDKKITMTEFSVEEANVEIYLITEEVAAGQVLAKAINSKGQEIGRSSTTLTLGKDDAKKISFTFGAELNLDKVERYIIDFRKQ